MEQLLIDGLKEFGLSPSAAPAMAEFARLLLEKNQVMNLTAITDEADVAALHFLDSAALASLCAFAGKTVIDVGTGAGFPGVPLRLLEPSMRLTLLDSLGKRVTFLQESCHQLGLDDVRCVHARAEEFALLNEEREQYDFALSRAVASLPLLAELCLPLVKVGGTFVAMKSVDCHEELTAARHGIALLGGQVQAVRDYSIPGAGVTHRAVLIRKKKETPSRYPRRFSVMKKSPL